MFSSVSQVLPRAPLPSFVIQTNFTHYIVCLAPCGKPLKEFEPEKATGSKQCTGIHHLAEITWIICSNVLCYLITELGVGRGLRDCEIERNLAL